MATSCFKNLKQVMLELLRLGSFYKNEHTGTGFDKFVMLDTSELEVGTVEKPSPVVLSETSDKLLSSTELNDC